ncbi:ORF6N domain-containing protein [candidate division KSB1 bacterium]
MLDYDLALLYGVETKRLKEAVKNNISRFPEDFMFELNKEEFEYLRTQIWASKRGGTRYSPLAFTEQGVSMLSSVLNSDKAIQINIEIMRTFVSYRSLLIDSQKLKKEIKQLDNKINHLFKYLLDKIDALHQKKLVQEQRKRIGYKRSNEKSQED